MNTQPVSSSAPSFDEAELLPPLAPVVNNLSCSFHTSEDTEYNAEVTGFNAIVAHAPDVVVAARSTEDVVAAVRHARDHGHRVSVHSTGHGADTCIDGGLLINTSRIQRLEIDPVIKIATIGAGLRWGAVVEAAGEHGLTPITGAASTVGVIGLLLGGGLGPLARSHGFCSDYIESFTVVVGNGETVEASPDQNADLFWALRGGKNGLGIVTEVRLRLIELSTLYGGSLFFEEEHIEPVLRKWVDWSASAPAQVTTSVAILSLPPLDFIPEPLRGRRVLHLRFAFPGRTRVGEKLAAPLRAAAPVYLDFLGEMPTTQIAAIHNDPQDPMPNWMRGTSLTHIDQEFASTLLSHAGPGKNPPFAAIEVRHIGGRTSRDVKAGSAVGGRPAEFTFGLFGAPVPELFEMVIPAAAAQIMESVEAWTSSEMNINFMGAPRSAEHHATAWSPECYARLADVRRKYDPNGVFACGYLEKSIKN
jgi:FAD/FMN-containing dehydrogenase